jgi:hypothetical protein
VGRLPLHRPPAGHDIEDQTLILADVARKALVQVQLMVRDL